MGFKQHIDRLFVPHGSSMEIDTNGLPSYPRHFYPVTQAGWENWQDKECIVLLGEPGLGKSTEFEFQHEALKKHDQFSFLFRLKDFYSGCTLDNLVDSVEFEKWKTWKDGPTIPAYFFFDSLDEARLEYEPILKEIVGQLRVFQCHRIYFRLSCRIRDWKIVSDKNSLGRLFPDKKGENGETIAGVTVLELLGLHGEGINKLTEEVVGRDADQFFRKAQEFKILHLCSHPLLLEFLLSEFKETGELGSTKTEVYTKAVERAFREENPEAKKDTTPAQRQDIAKKIAILSILSGHNTIHIPDLDTATTKSLDCTLTGEVKKSLKETLDTKVFTGAKAGEFRFYHRSLSEFLAAKFVDQKLREGMSFLHIQPLLFSDKGVPTHLRGTVSWLAAFNKTARDRCLKYDPLVVLEGDLAAYETPDKEAIIRILIERFKDREWQREVEEFGKLASGCDETFLKNLLAKDNSRAMRIMAIRMISQGHVDTLFDDLLCLAINDSEEEYIRRKAMTIIAEQGTAPQKGVLKTLLRTLRDNDPDDELTGIIIHNLFPKYLTVEDVFDTFHKPKNPNLVGSYHMFWHVSFEEKIADEDIKKVLDFFHPKLLSRKKYSVDFEDRYLMELLSKLFARALNAIPNIPIETTECWFKIFSDPYELHSLSHEKAIKEIVQWLKERPAIKRDLLLRYLDMNPPSEAVRFNSRDKVPFPIWAISADDFDWLCKEFTSNTDEWRKHAIFQILWAAWENGNYLPTNRFDRIDELSKTCTPCEQERLWRGFCPTENMWRKNKQQASDKEEAKREKNRKLAKEKIEDIRNGNLGWLEFFSNWMVDKGMEIFGIPAFSLLEDELGVDVREAAEKGYSRAWQNAPLSDIETLWSSNSIPWAVIAMAHAIEVEVMSKRIDWANLSPAQVGTAAIIALRFKNSLPEWFEQFYVSQKVSLEQIFDRIVTIEADSSDPYPRLSRIIAHSTSLNDEFGAYACAFLLSHPVPKNQAVLDSLLCCALRRPVPGLVAYLSQNAVNSWNDSLSEEEIVKVMSFLSAWWHVDWEHAWEFLIRKVLTNKNNSFAFISGIKRLFIKDTFTAPWPAEIPDPATIELVPYLYKALPPENDPKFEVMDEMVRLRDQVITYLSTIEPNKAHRAFLTWKDDPVFNKHRDWFLSIIDNLEHRMIDEQWELVSPEAIAGVLFRDARIIRNEEDLFILLLDVLDYEMREKLVDDTTLVPLLWEGTKKNGRNPKDEKPLQQILYNQLSMLLKEGVLTLVEN